MWRRTFLAGSIEAAAAALLARAAVAAPGPALTDPGERRGDMLYRPLQARRAMVSAIGLGGFHIGQQPTRWRASDHPRRRRPRHHVPRQLLGLQRRRERGAWARRSSTAIATRSSS
jgi:hypothetical protein